MKKKHFLSVFIIVIQNIRFYHPSYCRIRIFFCGNQHLSSSKVLKTLNRKKQITAKNGSTVIQMYTRKM